MKKRIIGFTFASFIVACHSPQKDNSTETTATSFFSKPIPEIDISFETYIVSAEKGGTVFYPSGTILEFPADAFVDSKGNIIKGNVEIKYREFRDPLDFYFAGIPMEYDSADTRFTFVSSGMNEILAFQNNQAVFVNQAQQPRVHFATNYVEDGHNIYFLDTVQQRWIYKKPSTVTTINNDKPTSVLPPTYSESYMDEKEPIKPQKADGKSPLITLDVDPASVEELKIYNNLSFQIAEDERSFKETDANEEWSDVELKKGKKQGYYTVLFSNNKRSVSFRVKAVFEGKEYEKAMQVYDEKIRQYELLKKQRIEKENLAKKKYLEDSLTAENIKKSNAETMKLNVLIEARNKQIEEENRQIALKNEETLKENERKREEYKNRIETLRKWEEEQNEKNRIIAENQEYNRSNVSNTTENKKTDFDKQTEFAQILARNDKSFRSFDIIQFGVWNCDHPALRNAILVKANFVDKNQRPLLIDNITVIGKAQNAIYRFEGAKLIGFDSSGDNLLIGTFENKIAYLSFDDYRNLKLRYTPSAQEKTIVLEIIEEKDLAAIKTKVWQ